MPDLQEVDEFTTAVPAFQDAVTPLSAAGLNPTTQALANRTRYLKNALGALLQSAFPIGSLYFNVSNAANPGALLGFGVWLAFGEGQMLLGAGTGYPVGATGGAATHTLTANEMPTHTHPTPKNLYWPSDASHPAVVEQDQIDGPQNHSGYSNTTGETGGGAAHNNMPPYIVVYIWRRVG